MKFQPRRFIKYYYLKFLRLKGDPKSIAKGIAVGTFTGITPIIPFHTVAILTITPLVRGNILAAFLASFASCNPLTYFPQYYFSWLIGNWLTPNDLSWERIVHVMDIVSSGSGYQDIFREFSLLGADTVIVLAIGGPIIAAPFAITSYFFSLKFFTSRREKKRKKRNYSAVPNL
jgi:uncharacterized protein (DUF2062 family)